MRLRALPVVVLGMSFCGCGDGAKQRAPVSYDLGDVHLTFRLDEGTFDLSRGGKLVFDHARADALVDDGSGPKTVRFGDGCSIVDATLFNSPRFQCASRPLSWDALTFSKGDKGGTVRIDLRLANTGSAPITILKYAPVVIDAASGGALFIGERPADHRILENGRFVAFDQTVQLATGDTPRFPLGNALPIPSRGNSASNWNHLVADVSKPAGPSLVAGFLTFDTVPTLGIGFDSAASRTSTDGRQSFTTYAAEHPYHFHGLKLPANSAIQAAPLYLDLLPADPVAALEDYANAIAKENRITPWPKRKGEVPNGWNSWSGGEGTGGYGQAINQKLILDNLEVFRAELKPFGGNYFQIDDGWQSETGDWEWNRVAFPDGGAYMAAQIVAAGLKPGLWIAAFSVSSKSMTRMAHPDWLQPAESGALGMFGKDGQTLDLTNPEALAFVDQTFSRIKADGFQWAKVDFTYYDVLGRPKHDPSVPNVTAYQAGWRQIRKTLGPDVFVVGIGLMGLNVGIADSMRLTEDNGPKWDEPDPEDVVNAGRAFKSTVRTGSRRWFYQNRVWVNHDDLIFFRSWPNGEAPPLSLEESKTFASWIGMGGGIVKVGDKLLDMEVHPEWIDVVRRLLPAWPDGARPVDVMLRDYPEQFTQHIKAPLGEWDNVALFNWGKNRDWSQNPPAQMEEAPRTFTLHCNEDCLAWEFWSEKFIGKMNGDFSVTVDPRRVQIISLRRPVGTPQLIGTNRHVTGGATDVVQSLWDAGKKTLATTITGAVGTVNAPWEYRMAFYAPGMMQADHAEADMAEAAPQFAQEGPVVRVRFSLAKEAQGKAVTVRLIFK